MGSRGLVLRLLSFPPTSVHASPMGIAFQGECVRASSLKAGVKVDPSANMGAPLIGRGGEACLSPSPPPSLPPCKSQALRGRRVICGARPLFKHLPLDLSLLQAGPGVPPEGDHGRNGSPTRGIRRPSWRASFCSANSSAGRSGRISPAGCT